MANKEFDKSAYVLYHSAQTGFPCLSFDVIPDDQGEGLERLNSEYLSIFLVTGTQAPRANQNLLHLLHFDKMTKFKRKRKKTDDEDDEDEESESSESEDDEENPDSQPTLRSIDIPHPWGEINRIRYTTAGSSALVAAWGSSGEVRIWDITRALLELKSSKAIKTDQNIHPIFTFTGHVTEGFGIDWSSKNPGHLATGDCDRNIHLWKPCEGGTWHVDQTPLMGHKSSVEDLQWSPTEANILASCSVDKTIKVWDVRIRPLMSCMLTIDEAHDADVNGISWNKKDPAFLLSGGDDGILKVWDFRKFASSNQKNDPIARFKYHCTPITSVEWDPNDNSVFGASGEDQITLWDLSVEPSEEEMDCSNNADQAKDKEKSSEDENSDDEDEDEDEEEKDEEEEEDKYKNVPPQLLFIHEGQKDVKELHFHPQIPGLIISTSADSFDIFKTISS